MLGLTLLPQSKACLIANSLNYYHQHELVSASAHHRNEGLRNESIINRRHQIKAFYAVGIRAVQHGICGYCRIYKS